MPFTNPYSYMIGLTKQAQLKTNVLKKSSKNRFKCAYTLPNT